MKKGTIYIFIIAILCSTTASCVFMHDPEEDFWDVTVHVKNNSSDVIYLTTADITDSLNTKNTITEKVFDLFPNETYREKSNSDFLKNYFIQIDIWNKSTIEKYTKEYIEEHDIVDKRYILNYYDLEKKDFQIVYE